MVQLTPQVLEELPSAGRANLPFVSTISSSKLSIMPVKVIFMSENVPGAPLFRGCCS